MLKNNYILGTRGSRLALVQAEAVVAPITQAAPATTIQIQTIQTSGDRFRGKSLATLGGKGLFVKEIEEALWQGKIDLAVHSLKDLPGELPEGLALACFPKREDPRDCLVSIKYQSLADLPKGAVVGTSSPRRVAQLMAKRPDLKVEPIRGNVDTRLEKLKTQDYDALVLAVAGLKRLKKTESIKEYFDPNFLVPAIGQGILAVEVRKDQADLIGWLQGILNDPPTAKAAEAERAFLQTMGGDCYTPLGAYAWVDGGMIRIRGWLGLPDGSKQIWLEKAGPSGQNKKIGEELAQAILRQGGKEVLDAIVADPAQRTM